MSKLAEHWSEQRRLLAQQVASGLYGVVAILTAEFAVQPGELDYAEAVIGALLVGVGMTATRIFVRVVEKETEIGAHLDLAGAIATIRESLLVMAFPVLVAVIILIAGLFSPPPGVLLYAVLYLSLAAVFIVGFVSSYVLDRKLGIALTRGAGWLVLSLVLLGAKTLA
jgi:VIT1/CCC1 family predicted Fe2+/Mn2+ transporter